MNIIENLEKSWQEALKSEFKKSYLKEIEQTLENDEKN
jgi:uracil DNA glycosylase